MDEQELKHWGILGMKWGVRRFQNEDGSLTPQGRERYGVGVTKNVKGMNDGSSLSNEELRNMERRYRSQANYYKARNDYLYEQNRYAELTAPKKKKTNAFLQNVFEKPLENTLAAANQATFTYLGGAMAKSIFGDKADNFIADYYGLAFNRKNDKKDKKDDDESKKYDDTKKEKNTKSDELEKSSFDTNASIEDKLNMYWDSKEKEFVFQLYDDDDFNKDEFDLKPNKTYPFESVDHESKKGFGATPNRKR